MKHRSSKRAADLRPRSFRRVAAGIALALAGALAPPVVAGYIQDNLVSNQSGTADFTDPNLLNPWGLSSSASGPFWVSDNGAGVSTLYSGSGQPSSLVVTIPPAPGGTSPATPTGQVFNAGSSFEGYRFIFATEDGTIAGWKGGTTAELRVATPDAVYKGLAIGNDGTGDFLYAANFQAGTIDVFDTNFGAVTLSGAFTDPNLPADYAPFNIQNLGGRLYVTYAQKEAGGSDDVAGAGHGFVNVFNPDGSLVQRLISDGALNSPWGLALAPAGFGEYSEDLLVGNFGDGRINAFDPTTGAFLGALADTEAKPIVIDGLWGLQFGNGGQAGLPTELFFTAGPNEEQDGLFGRLTVPEPATLALVGLGFAGMGWARRRMANAIV